MGVRVAKIMQMTDLWRGGSMNRRRPCRGSCWPDAAIRLHLPVPQTSDGPSIRPLGRCRSAVHSFHFELLAEETLQCLPAAAAFFHRFNSSFNWLPASRAHFCIDEISRRTSWGPAEPSLECAAPIFQIPWKNGTKKLRCGGGGGGLSRRHCLFWSKKKKKKKPNRKPRLVSGY